MTLPASSIAALLQSATSCCTAYRNTTEDGENLAIQPNAAQQYMGLTAAVDIGSAASKGSLHSFAGCCQRFSVSTSGRMIPA